MENISKKIHCALCGSDDASVICREAAPKKGEVKKINNVICNRCSLIYNNPAPTESELREYYAGGFLQNMHGNNNFIELVNTKKNQENQKLKGVINFLEIYINQNSKVLDIGCSAGDLLFVIKDKFACKVSGIEADQSLSRFAKEVYGITSIENIFFDGDYANNTENKYDIVILRHVLEHLIDPNETIQSIKKILTANGLLYLAIPNADDFSWSRTLPRCLEYGHLYSFTPYTISQLLLKHGMKVVKWQYDYSLHLQVLATKIENEQENCIEMYSFSHAANIKKLKLKLKYHFVKNIFFRCKRKVFKILNIN